MEQLLAALNGLGPWGVLIGVVVMGLIQFAKAKLGTPSTPTEPTRPSDSPILDWLMARIRERLAPAPVAPPTTQAAPPNPDIDPAKAVAILKALEAQQPSK